MLLRHFQIMLAPWHSGKRSVGYGLLFRPHAIHASQLHSTRCVNITFTSTNPSSLHANTATNISTYFHPTIRFHEDFPPNSDSTSASCYRACSIPGLFAPGYSIYLPSTPLTCSPPFRRPVGHQIFRSETCENPSPSASKACSTGCGTSVGEGDQCI